MDDGAWLRSATGALRVLAPSMREYPVSMSGLAVVADVDHVRAMVRSVSAQSLLGAYIALSRVDIVGMRQLVVPEVSAGPLLPTAGSLSEWALAFESSDPPVQVSRLGSECLFPIDSEGTVQVTFPGVRIPEPLEEVLDRLSESEESIEVAWYRDGVFLEYCGVPVVGVREARVVLGIDRRDHAMSLEAYADDATRLRLAPEVFERVVASRHQRDSRIDLSKHSPGRRLRSAWRSLRDGCVPVEVEDSGGSGQRAYCVDGGVVVGFGRGSDPFLPIETALVRDRVDPSGESLARCVVSSRAHWAIQALAKQLLRQCDLESMEGKEDSGG
ncbi:MAG: hypothetical protein ACYDHP_06270 [Ferrimicrobium sp.]